MSDTFTQPEPEPELTAKQRLIFGAQVLNNLPSKEPPAPEIPKEPDIGNINLAARKAQYVETDATPDPEQIWRKLAAHPKVVRDRPGELYRKLLDGSALEEPEWEELKVNLSSIAESVKELPDSFSLGRGNVSSLYSPQGGTWFTVDYPGQMSSEDLPASLTAQPIAAITPESLDWPAGEFSVFVGPTDVVYAATPTPEHDFQLRQYYPGPKGKDGVPRWLPVAPLPVQTHRQVEASALAEPGVVIDSYMRPDHYSGTKGGDYIVWDVPERVGPRQWQPPAWMQGRATKTPAATQSPKYGVRAVPKKEIIDQWMLDERLADTSWAVIQAQGDPQSTSHVISRLKRQGLEPIELEGGDRKAWLVFGVDPSQMGELSHKRAIYTNSGVIASDAITEEPEPQAYQFSTASGTVQFITNPGLTTGAIPRTQRRVERWSFQVDPDQAKRLAQFAKDLETIGAQNVSVYSRESEIDGFEPAREYLFDDGVSMRVARTASTEIGEPNAIPLHVRSTAGLPKGRVAVV